MDGFQREGEGRREGGGKEDKKGRENVDLAMYLETVTYDTGILNGSGVAFIVYANLLFFLVFG